MGVDPGMAELKAKLLELLRTDEEFRLAVAGLIGLDEVLKAIRSLQEQVAENTGAIRSLQEQVRSLQEQVRSLQEQVAENSRAIRSLQEQVRSLQEQVVENTKAIRELREDMNRGFKRYDEELARLRADMHEGFKRHDEELARLREDLNKLRADMLEGFKLLRRHIDALGARWGLMAEEAFREGVKGVVERYFGGKVERWSYRDEEGVVFGYPAVVEADIVISDGEHILMEIKSSVSRADVFELWKIGRLYERVKGVRPKLAIVSPFVREEAKRTAEELGIELYTDIL